METNIIQEKINQKADSKLKYDVNNIFQTKNWDVTNTFIEKDVLLNALGNNSSVRAEYIINILIIALIEKYKGRYREIETKAFLDKVEAIDSDLKNLREELNL